MPKIYVPKADTGSNKPGKFVVPAHLKAYSYTRASGFEVFILKPIIDRFSVTFDVTEAQKRIAIRQNLEKLCASSDKLVTPWKKLDDWGSPKYANSFAINCNLQTSSMLQLAPEKPKKGAKGNLRFMRLDMNPSVLGASGMKALHQAIPKLTAGLFEYADIVNAGNVTRLDIAVDIVNLDIEDVFISTKGLGKSHSYFSAAGKAETIYLNVTGKGSKLSIYDKKTQLAETGSKQPHTFYKQAKQTRVEFRKNYEKPPAKLLNSQNPFKEIRLIDVEAPELPTQPYIWKLFTDSCHYRGIEGALQQLDFSLRKKFGGAILDSKDYVWKPDELWSYWPHTLKASQILG